MIPIDNSRDQNLRNLDYTNQPKLLRLSIWNKNEVIHSDMDCMIFIIL